MAQRNWTFVRDEEFPSWWPNALAAFISSQVSDRFSLTLASSTTIQLAASADDGLVAIAIDGRWRYIETTITRAHPGGGAATYDVYVTAADNNITNSPDPHTDRTDYSFALAIVASGRTPAGVDLSRKVAELTWSGTAITAISMRVGGATWDSVTAEATARGAADTTLQANIDAIVGVQNFGDGSDGAVLFDGTTTVLGLVPSSATYTMTRDIYATDMSFSGNCLVITNGFRIFCSGRFTFGGGTIRNNGGQGGGGGASGPTAGTGGPPIGGTGSDGGTGAASGTNTGGAGRAVANAQGGAGGQGGSTGGLGGTATLAAGGLVRSLMDILIRRGSTDPFLLGGGSGGGGGSTVAGSAAAGGGGGGGGAILIVAKSFEGRGGIMQANGGPGAPPGGSPTGALGGGGGGGGGVIYLIGQAFNNSSNTIQVNGGSGGNAGGTGSRGASGANGIILRFLIR